jgi:transcriptional regulator with XRE-family HTH domain
VTDGYLAAILLRFQKLREAKKVTPEQIERKLILGPGWVGRFETGATVPNLDMLFAMLNCMGATMDDLLRDLDVGEDPAEISRYIHAVPAGRDLNIHFQYANFDAVYKLPSAKISEFEKVLTVMRDGLARLSNESDVGEALKTDAVAKSFLAAAKLWPRANPSDLWYFLIYRAYCDPFNHPAKYARMNFDQSWKRTGGWALEEVLVRHYEQVLASNGIKIVIATTEEKQRYLQGAKKVVGRLEADKADVLLLGEQKGKTHFFGVVHVKASFAERRTDDVPMSKALVDAGYISPLWTMDCKSGPGAQPVNRGELGGVLADRDNRSAKRIDIEDDGYFSACFSYNRNTKPTPPAQKAKARVHVCDFTNPKDAFSDFIIKGWKDFPHR